MSSWHRTQNSLGFETAEFIISGAIPIVLIVVGTIGNLTAVFILLNKENRRTSTNIYLIFLCIVDTISLYQWNLSQAFKTFTNGEKDIWGNSVIMCKLSEFFAFYTLHTSAMFLTFVELDRACLLRSVWYKRKIAQPHAAIKICIIILILLFILDGFLFGLGFEYSYVDYQTNVQQIEVACYYSMNADLNDFFGIKYPWIHIVMMYFLPFSVIFFCTLFTIKKLLIKQSNVNNQFINSARRNRRISLMLLFMCLTYFISTLPNRLCFSVFADQIVDHDYTDTIFLATNTLMYTRNALNAFFFYISVFGFRRSIRNLILKCLGKHATQIHPANHTLTLEHLNTGSTARGKTALASVQMHGSIN